MHAPARLGSPSLKFVMWLQPAQATWLLSAFCTPHQQSIDVDLVARECMPPLTAGMQICAEIVQGKRTVLEYLLSPVQRVTSEAGRER